jgi:acyl-CoA synthetase (AMP-forming)/AMP-acid ligase II
MGAHAQAPTTNPESALPTRRASFDYLDSQLPQAMTNKAANAFRELGVMVDDRVLILMLDVPQFYAIFWGAIKIDAVPIPVNTMLSADDYEYYLNDSRAKVLALSEQMVPVISEIKGHLHYIRHVITIPETRVAHIPFKQMYRHLPSRAKTEFTTKRRRRLLALQFGFHRSAEGGHPFPL